MLAFAAVRGIAQTESGAAATSSGPSGSVSGKVTCAAGRKLPEMVVYLESTEAGRRFPAPVDSAVIAQKGAKFSPPLLVIAAGQTVEFRNDEDRPIEHNVFSSSPSKPFDLGLYRPGSDKRVVFDKPGLVRLYCSIHRYMDGLIYVCPSPFFALVATDGSYRIEGIPAGKYRISTWQKQRRFADRSNEIEIPGGERVSVDFEMGIK